ncbi:YadA-like family protein, partial [Veillonella montpellierensis]|uniref:YadA-like family protein n=1 Tax=Veillonella montpellierensis TaxID=187328 RepID=UPI0023F91807
KITRLNYKDKAGKNHQVATLDDGMKYSGDNAKADGTNVLKKKLNNQVDIVGDIKDKDVNHFISGNIGVFAYDGKLHVKLAKDITGLDSVTSGIVNATNKIVVGDPDKNGKGQGKVATLTTSDDGKLMLQNAGVDTPREVLTVTEKNNTTTIILGEAGENGKDGKNGHIGVNGKDGKPGVGIDGKDGITLEGEAGKNGLSIKGEPGKPGDPAPTIAGLNGKGGIGHLGLTGAKGADGKTPSMDMTVIAGNTDVNGNPDTDKMTRLNYKDEAGKEHQVATLTDGLKFAGNNKTVSKQTLNSTVQIVGQGLQAGDADGEAKLSDGKTKFVGTNDNIGVISDGKGKLTVALHEDVKVKTVTATDGITVGKGEGAVALKGKDGKLVLEVKDKDGKTTETKEVLTTGSSNITVGSKAEKPHDGKPGTDGQDGTIGVNGKNGSTVVLNGKDGSIGLNGENGKDGISIRGKAGENIPGQAGKDGINGKTGIDGTDVTRIVYTEKNPDDSDKKDTNGKPITHQVANLDDGMKYAGDNAGENGANVLAKKLNNQVDIVGDIAKDKTENDFTKGNIGVFANATDGKLHVKLAKTVDGLDKVSTKKVVIGDPDKNVTTLSTDDTGRLVLQKGTKEDAPKETILTATQVTDPSGKVVGDELHLGSGKDGINGKITADGKDGKSKVGIDGTDGITITGHTDAKDGQPAKDGTIGINGTNGITMTGDAAKAGIQIENGPVLNAEGLDMKDKGIKGLGSISAKTINATDDKGNTTVSMNGKNGTLSFAGTTGADGKAIPGVTLGTNNGRLVVLDDNNKPKDTVALVSDLQDIVNKTDTAIMKIDRNVRNVGANAAAMAMLKPLQYDPLEPTQIMAAIGSYRGTQAAAIGLSHYTNESTMFNVGVSVGAGNNMMGVGVTRKFGSSADERAVPDRYKAGPISSVYVMQDEVTALKAENRQIKASYYKVLQDNEEMKAKLDALMKKLGL